MLVGGVVDKFERMYQSTPATYGRARSSQLVRFVEGRGIAPPGRALDLGCGQGRNIRYLAGLGFDVVAMDGSQAALAETRRVCAQVATRVDTKQVDLAEVRLPAETFNLVVANTVLDHLPQGPGERLAQALCESLTVGGHLFVSAFTTDDPGYTQRPDRSQTAFGVQHYFAPGELRMLFGCLQLLTYHEEISLDTSHGPPHYHGIARLMARRA